MGASRFTRRVSVFLFIFLCSLGQVVFASSSLHIMATMPEKVALAVSDQSASVTTVSNLGSYAIQGVEVGAISVGSNVTDATLITIISQNGGLKSESVDPAVDYSVTLSSAVSQLTIPSSSDGVTVPVLAQNDQVVTSPRAYTLAVNIPRHRLQSGTYCDKMIVQLASL